jgi:hypothetical protein
MARREWPLRFTCKHPGCSETATYRYPTLRERTESAELRWYGGGKGWLCIRHAKPEDVLSADNPETRKEIEVRRSESGGNFFGSSGFLSGPGFKAWADDFPPGARLIVTARIEMPAENGEHHDNQG